VILPTTYHGPSVPAPSTPAVAQRVLSGIQPSGDLHLGNYLGALRNWVSFQQDKEALYCVVDLHALTLDSDPTVLRASTLDAATNLLAAGLDPKRCTIFLQSDVPEHTRLAWLLECTATMGELRRMTQFKEKAGGQEAVRVGLFTYPVLMASDILLYQASLVPVGDDQRQHLELTRELAIRCNNRYGPVFTVPEAAVPPVAARVMDLQHPERKMSKSVDSPLGTIRVLDPPEEIERKVRRAVTDTGTEVRFDPVAKPGVSNLLQLLAAATGRTPSQAAEGYTRYGDLKADTASAVVELLRPVRQRHRELTQDQAYVRGVLAEGAGAAGALARDTYARAAEAVGLLTP
jgi:tryptophanyl-tRNA synthetase